MSQFGTLIDSNVILDVITKDPNWLSWSESALIKAADKGHLFINPMIYSEVSICFDTIEDLNDIMTDFIYLDIPKEACFLAGKCFLKYRKQKGEKRSPLPDFFIGAHAAIAKLPLLTRDKGRFETYFPKLNIISP